MLDMTRTNQLWDQMTRFVRTRLKVLMLLCFTHPARWQLLLQPLKGAEGGERRGPMGDSCQPRAANRRLCSVVSPRLWSSQ